MRRSVLLFCLMYDRLNDKEVLVIQPVHPCVNPPAGGAFGGALVTALFQHMYVQVPRPTPLQ